MKFKLLILPVIALTINSLVAQEIPASSRIDNFLIQGNYEKVIDTCKLILASDSLKPEIYYKMGIAYQNIIEADSVNQQFLPCF